MNFVALGEGSTEEGQGFLRPQFSFKPLADEDQGVLHILVRRIFREVLTVAPPTAIGIPPIPPTKTQGKRFEGGWSSAIKRLQLLIPVLRFHPGAQAIGGVSFLVAVIDKNCSLDRLTRLEDAACRSTRSEVAIVSCSDGSARVFPDESALTKASLYIVLALFRPFTEYVVADGGLPAPPPCDHRWSGYVKEAKERFGGPAAAVAARQLNLSSPDSSTNGLADLTRGLEIILHGK
jgi:hypothetical protein